MAYPWQRGPISTPWVWKGWVIPGYSQSTWQISHNSGKQLYYRHLTSQNLDYKCPTPWDGVGLTLCTDGLALISQCVKFWSPYIQRFLHGNGIYFKNFGFWSAPSPLCGGGSTPKILSLIKVGHHAKFSRCSYWYYSWSLEITSMKKFGTGCFIPVPIRQQCASKG